MSPYSECDGRLVEPKLTTDHFFSTTPPERPEYGDI
jgi:hypothetical protein